MLQEKETSNSRKKTKILQGSLDSTIFEKLKRGWMNLMVLLIFILVSSYNDYFCFSQVALFHVSWKVEILIDFLSDSME